MSALVEIVVYGVVALLGLGYLMVHMMTLVLMAFGSKPASRADALFSAWVLLSTLSGAVLLLGFALWDALR